MDKELEFLDKVLDDFQEPKTDWDQVAEGMEKLVKELSFEEGVQKSLESREVEDLLEQVNQVADTPEFENMMEGLMSQLLSKELLYEPIKELAVKYPEWLQKNEAHKDVAMYQKQYEFILQVVEIYDKNGDENKVMTLIEHIQECGQPPAELLKEMAPDLDLENPQLPNGENCIVM